MGVGDKRIYLASFLCLLLSCTEEEEKFIIEEEPYFLLDCVRYLHNETDLWQCMGNPNTELIQGDILLSYFSGADKSDPMLFFCGQNVVLNSGNQVIDNLVTNRANENGRTCFKLPSSFGEFEWNWDNSTTLTINWIDQNRLMLYIPPSEILESAQGRVYCYGLLSDIYC